MPASWTASGSGILAATVALALAGCAASPVGLLVPLGPVAGTERVNMLAATTRAPSGDAATLFGGERGGEVSFTNIVVSLPPDRQPGTIQLPRRQPGDPATDFVVSSANALTQREIPGWFDRAGGRKRVLVFVHGFNTSFERAVFRFAQLAHDADARAAPVLFSWPSRGRLLDYRLDLDNASYSRSDLARLLDTAAASPHVGEIVILAHSMGGWLAVEAVKQLALKRGGVPGKINNLILASPDLDIGVFRRQIEDMGKRRPRITVFAARNDRALQLSGFLARGATRLGAVDISAEDYQRQLRELPGVTVIDLSAIEAGDRINHDTYASSPEIVRLIGDRLIQGQVVTDTDVSGTATAVESLGSAAGLLITAPIRVFDAAAARQP